MSQQQRAKTCFVTIGATASFNRLIKAVLSSDVLDALERQGYSELLIQYGSNGESLFDDCKNAGVASGDRALKISGFDLDKTGLTAYLRRAKGFPGAGQEGVVISHAGSGTILDALRISVPLIVVPNDELLDNHQVELAEALAKQEYVVHGRLESLAQALEDAEQLRKRQRSWPPPNSGVHRQTKGLKDVLDEEMGFLD